MLAGSFGIIIDPDTLARHLAGSTRIALFSKLHSAAPTDKVTLQEFLVWWRSASEEWDPGVFTRLSFQGGLGLHRQALDVTQAKLLRRAGFWGLLLCSALSFCAVALTFEILDLNFEQGDGLRACANCTVAATHPHIFLHTVVYPPRECDISDAVRNLHFVLLRMILVPVLFMAALIWYASALTCLKALVISFVSVPYLL